MSRKSLGGGFLGLMLVWSAFVGVLLPGTGWAQWVKLSDGTSSRLVDNSNELYTAPIDGGLPAVQLNESPLLR